MPFLTRFVALYFASIIDQLPLRSRSVTSNKLAAITLLFFCMPINAQEDGMDYFDLSLQALVQMKIYSASKISETISEAPSSIVIIKREEIERYGYVTLADLLRSTPGFYHMYNYNEDQIGVRGILGGEIILLVNNIPQHTNQLKHFAFVPEVIDRIEIVRGPMSVTNGNGAFLGSINIITNENISNKQSVKASATYGSSDTYKASFGLKKQNNDYSLSLAGSLYDTDGLDVSYADVVSPEQLSSFPVGSHSSTEGDLERSNNNIILSTTVRNFYAQIQYNNTVNEWFLGTPSFHDGNEEITDITTVSLGYKQELASWISGDFRVVYSDFNERRDYDFFSVDFVGHRDIDEKRLEAELTLSIKSSEKLEGMLGFNIINIHDAEYELFLPAFNIDITIDNDDAITKSLFGQVNYNVTNNLKLIVGARVEKDLSYKTYRTGRADLPGGVGVVHDDEESHFIPRAAVVYTLNEENTFKLIYGEATRDPAKIDSPIEVHDKRELIENIEILHILSLSNLMVQTSVFRSEISNLNRFFQQVNPDTNQLETKFDNSGKLETYGIELLTMYRPTDALTLEFSTTYTSLEDKKNDFSVGNSPDLLIKGKVSYDYGNFSFSVVGNFVDEMRADWSQIDISGNAVRVGDDVDAYLTFDTYVRYQHSPSGLSLGFLISNLFDSEVRYPASGDTPFEQGLIDQERALYVSASKQF